MPLEQPSQSNGYTISAIHQMTLELWQAVLTSLHGRLVGLEAVAGSFETALGDEAIALAQGRIDDAIVPQLTQVQQEMTAIQAAILLAEDQLAALQNGGVQAENVPLAGASALFPLGTDAQEAFGIIETVLAWLDDGLGSVSGVASGAQQKSEKGLANGYASLDETGRVPISQTTPIPEAFSTALFHVRDEKPSGSQSFTTNPSTAGWYARDLNTVLKSEIPGASLSANRITLPPGDYFIDATLPAFRAGGTRARLVNQANNGVILDGQNDNTASTSPGSGSLTPLKGRFTLAGQTTLRLEHYYVSPTGSSGGNALSSGVEIYSNCLIWKVG